MAIRMVEKGMEVTLGDVTLTIPDGYLDLWEPEVWFQLALAIRLGEILG